MGPQPVDANAYRKSGGTVRNIGWTGVEGPRVDLDAAKQWLARQGVQTLEDLYNNRDAAMREAYSPSAYMDGQGTPGLSQTQQILRGLAGQDAKEQAKMDFLASLFGGTGSGSAGPSAAQIQAAIDKINEDYDRQLGSLVARRDQGANSIAAALGDFRSATAGNNNLYNMASQQISDGIAARLAQALADAQSSQQAGARQADALGWNGAAIQANAANNTQALTNSIRYQQDLADRYRQVQANSQNQTANAGELVNQGAVGRLTGGYLDAVNALEQARSDAVYSARNPGGGGGGGGSSKAPSPRDYMAGLDLYDRMYGSSGSIDPTTAYMYQMFRQDPTGFAGNDATKQYMPQIGQIEADRLNKQLGYYPQNYS